MIKFPLYKLRVIDNIFEEGEFVIAQSHFNRYVIDLVDKKDSFIKRRLKLSELARLDKLPYSIYKLPYRIDTITQLINADAKTFINADGEIEKWTKSKFYKITLHKVISIEFTDKGNFLVFLHKIQQPIITTKEFRYIAIVNYKGFPIIYNGYYEKPGYVPSKVKL